MDGVREMLGVVAALGAVVLALLVGLAILMIGGVFLINTHLLTPAKSSAGLFPRGRPFRVSVSSPRPTACPRMGEHVPLVWFEWDYHGSSAQGGEEESRMAGAEVEAPPVRRSFP